MQSKVKYRKALVFVLLLVVIVMSALSVAAGAGPAPIPTPAAALLDAGTVISDGSGWMIYLIGGLLGFVSLGLGVYYAFRVARGVKKLGKG